jgi:hypothetical protein
MQVSANRAIFHFIINKYYPVMKRTRKHYTTIPILFTKSSLPIRQVVLFNPARLSPILPSSFLRNENAIL